MSKKKKKKNNQNTSVDEVKIEEEIQETEESIDEDSLTAVEDNSSDEIIANEKENISNEEIIEYEEEVPEIVATKVVNDKKKYDPTMCNMLLIFVLLCSLGHLIGKLIIGDDVVMNLIGSMILLLFSMAFILLGFNSGKRKKKYVILGSFLLILFFVFSLGSSYFNINNQVIDFSNMKLNEAIKWFEKNDIELVQTYEYSDMIDEYHVIAQDVKAGSLIKNTKSITLSISEGPNPNKMVAIPSMVGWTSEQVLDFILKNKLTNVNVSFIVSEGMTDTVIKQSKVGNLARNEKLEIEFSLGEGNSLEEIKLIDFKKKSEFESIFYLKKNQVNYEIKYAFSNSIKKGYVIKQSIDAGKTINIKNDKVVITVSKGPEIKITELRGMSMSDITDWVISNKLKLEFTDQYDDTTKENHVISANYSNGDVVEEGTVIKIVVSKGKLVMPKFNNLNEFRDWVNKYNINSEEKHEFSDSVAIGNIIRFSHKEGDVIKNTDTVVVTISDGKKISVPNVVGISKDSAASKLKNAGLGYNFVYSYSDSVAKGNTIRQSISAGAGVSQGTVVTVTVSNGKKPYTPPAPTTPSCDKSKGSALNIQYGSSGSQTVSMIKQMNPNHKFSFNYVTSCPNGSIAPGSVCNGASLDGVWKNYCDTITVTVIK